MSKRKAANAAQNSWAAYREWQAECVTLDKDKNIHISIELGEEKLASSSSSPLSAGMAKARRYAILYVYTEVYGCAPENKWDDFDDDYGMRLPTIIMKHLMIPRGSYQAVITAMREMYAAHENGETYDPSGNLMSRCGAKVKIVEMSPQAELVYSSMERGMGLGNTLVLLNAWRRRKLLPGPISYGALQRFVANSPVLKIDKRELRKAGTDDEESGWALARHAFAQQLFRQFRKGRRGIDGKAGPGGSARRETKARKRDRKDTVAQELVSHPELKEAVEILLGGADSD